MIKKISSILIFICISFALNAQKLLKDCDAYITTFDNVKSKTLVSSVVEMSKDCRIVGMGEVSHYTKECYELKHSMILGLLDQGFEGLVLEVDFGQAQVWNDYVCDGKGDLDDIIATSGWFTYRTEEFKRLISDIREFNKTAETHFQIFGMEMTAVNHNYIWLEYFLGRLPGQDYIIDRLSQKRQSVAFYEYTEEEIFDHWELYFELNDILIEDEEEYIEVCGAKNFEMAKRIVEIQRQFATYISQDDFSFKSEIRDQFSARNTLWCLDQINDNAKLLVWAHNGHVNKESVMFSYDVFGHYMNQWFGEEYLAIGFTYDSGEFGAFSTEGFKRWTMESETAESLTKEFHEFESPFLILDIRKAMEDEKASMSLSTEVLTRRDSGESFSEEFPKLIPINLSNTFDAFIYIDETSFPTRIEWKE